MDAECVAICLDRFAKNLWICWNSWKKMLERWHSKVFVCLKLSQEWERGNPFHEGKRVWRWLTNGTYLKWLLFWLQILSEKDSKSGIVWCALSWCYLTLEFYHQFDVINGKVIINEINEWECSKTRNYLKMGFPLKTAFFS